MTINRLSLSQIKPRYGFKAIGLLVFLSVLALALSLKVHTAFAATPAPATNQLPSSELEALHNYTHWVADVCAGSGSGPTTPGVGAGTGSGALSIPLRGTGVQEEVFNYFIDRGLNAAAAAGIDGNFGQESTWNPSDGGGYLAQWGGVRLTALQALATKEGKPITDLGLQLDYAWLELTNGPGAGADMSAVLQQLQSVSATDPSKAADIFQGPPQSSPGFEDPSTDPLTEGTANREKNAVTIYNQYSGNHAVAGSGSCCPPSGSGSSGSATTTPATKPNFVDLTSLGGPMGHGKLSKINALVIHYTEGSQEGAALAKDVLIPEGDGVQFNIGVTGTVYQYFPLDNMQEAYHVGDINDHSIGIEITGADGEALLNNQAQFNSVVNTVQYLCSYYSIPCSDPIGDITGDHNDPSKAQGMLGHSEAPNPICGDTCNHSDPDTKIVHGVEYNIVTGNVWSDADRSNSSIHAYMMKLRTALGYDPTPGQSGAGTPVSGAPTSCTQTPTPSSGSLVWPFATKSASQYNRVDQGWDLQDKAGANVYAIASGTLHIYAPNPGPGLFGNDYPVEELDNSIGGPNNWVYYGHVHIVSGLDGQHVNAGQLIAHANSYYGQNGSGVVAGWLEIGFSHPGNDQPLDPPPFPTAAGTTMQKLLLNAVVGPGGN